MARSVQVNSTAPAPGRTTRTVSSPAASNSPLPGLPLSTSTPSARSSCTSNSDHPVNSNKSSSSHRPHSADSGVYDAPPDMATSLQQIIAQLQESNQEMNELTRQMKDIDKRVHSLEDEDADHEGDGRPDKKRAKKRKCRANGLSKDVQNLVRRTYTALKEEVENSDKGFEWDVSLRFDNPCNSAVMTKLAEEVKALNPATPSTAIRDAAHISSLTLKQSLEDSGKYLQKCVVQRRKNPKKRILEMRQASLAEMKTLDNRSKQRWLIALVIDMISSEESEWQDENDSGSKKPMSQDHWCGIRKKLLTFSISWTKHTSVLLLSARR